tara:strand:+ start:75 stop:692 length:618 start_codon:yes stop_codon:yes gene_type:complete
MTDLMERLQNPLKAHEIDFRVQSINRGGYATVLAYKDARVDMKRLDEVFGVAGWQRDYKMVGNMFLCGVSIRSEDGEWITKWDTGTESNAEAVKGLASDAFKRSCFNLGIGRELYDYPVISIKLNGGGDKNGSSIEWFLDEKDKDRYGKPKVKAGWGLNLKEWVWHSVFDEESKELTFLAAKEFVNNKWVMRYQFGSMSKQEKPE